MGRDSASRRLRIYVQELAIGDPALYAAEVLRDALLRRGVSIQGAPLPAIVFPMKAAKRLRAGGGPGRASFAAAGGPVCRWWIKSARTCTRRSFLREVGGGGRAHRESRSGASRRWTNSWRASGFRTAQYQFTRRIGPLAANPGLARGRHAAAGLYEPARASRRVDQFAAHRRRGWNARARVSRGIRKRALFAPRPVRSIT